MQSVELNYTNRQFLFFCLAFSNMLSFFFVHPKTDALQIENKL